MGVFMILGVQLLINLNEIMNDQTTGKLISLTL